MSSCSMCSRETVPQCSRSNYIVPWEKILWLCIYHFECQETANSLAKTTWNDSFMLSVEKIASWVIESGCKERYKSDNSLIRNLELHDVTRSICWAQFCLTTIGLTQYSGLPLPTCHSFVMNLFRRVAISERRWRYQHFEVYRITTGSVFDTSSSLFLTPWEEFTQKCSRLTPSP